MIASVSKQVSPPTILLSCKTREVSLIKEDNKVLINISITYYQTEEALPQKLKPSRDPQEEVLGSVRATSRHGRGFETQ